ncbi:winged helix-turn-helix domain-containing protein [Bradyrhizobium sp. LHD-71]|uniref:ATP-binding protein n=1 Tax=Bradyrhizobium sp. LHD-71 TaxID=3072141 RepID=UPI00280E0474|nr:winged helix-turn-helix domain-containing protein [Bradyrhizobium sp. LHD-71]MDQ8732582.1 winged helix-turn-helix domain-containing protein [Bradyrhizobium sp. LHD-71]
MKTATATADAIGFGPFCLSTSERLLTKEGVPVELGARTLDTLIALISRPNEVISKNELMAQVWPDVTVEEGSLRFHMAKLRKALGDGKDGARYITTLAGRGYCFVAPISVAAAPEIAASDIANVPRANLPARSTRMFGRADGVRALSAQLTTSRFVTIVGSGGVGKTTVAVEVAYELLETFAGAVTFVDLSALNDPKLVASSLAAMLGLPVQSDDPLPSLIAYLRDKRMLVIFDNCEHVIDATAALAERIFLAAPQVHILATSREALRVKGEQIHRLAPLAVPPADSQLTAAAALAFPAVQLFVERAAASGARLELSDADVATVANICRRLDGLALAIELAAGRVEGYGLQQIATLLDERLTLIWLGQRTAPPRQKTLQATLDWSYGLLSETERVVLRRLAVFVGTFTLEAVRDVVTSATIDQQAVLGALDSLVAKSMVATTRIGPAMRYRLLDMTRAYALGIATDDTEIPSLAARHANYCRRSLERTDVDRSPLTTTNERAPNLADLGNIRAALEWCFGESGDTEIGVGLAAAAVPVFLKMSLLTECHRWSERAILALNDASRSQSEEMHLQAALGLSSMFAHGESEDARAALIRSLAIAEQRGDTHNQLQLLGPLHMFHLRTGDFRAALRYAMRGALISKDDPDPTIVALALSLLGISFSHMGDLDNARAELEAALERGLDSPHTSTIYLGFDHHKVAEATLARTLWLQGHPAAALERARRTIEDAADLEQPVTLSVALIWAVSILLWAGDLDQAEAHIDWFMSHAETYSMAPFLAVALGFKGELAIHRGDAMGGIESLQQGLEKLHALRYELLTPTFNIALVQGLTAVGRHAEALALIDETIRQAEANEALSHMPELLRVKGCVLLAMAPPMRDEAESCFAQSLEWSGRQGARACELRTAVDLAALWADQRKSDAARSLLQPVVEQFAAAANTADLTAARQLLASLKQARGSSSGQRGASASSTAETAKRR